MKIKTVENFVFYIMPKIIKFSAGEILHSGQYSNYTLNAIVKNGHAEIIEDDEEFMENKMMDKTSGSKIPESMTKIKNKRKDDGAKAAEQKTSGGK